MNAHIDHESQHGHQQQQQQNSSDHCACACCTLDDASDSATSSATNSNNSNSTPATHTHLEDTPALIHLHAASLVETPQFLFLNQQIFAEPAEAEAEMHHSDSLFQELLDAVDVDAVDSSDALNRLVAMALLVASTRVD
ncbi:hypothetical protein HDU81_001368, partial [Chytriomyces hyalinus]